MSKDTIKVNMNIYDMPIVVEQLNKLEQENKQLKERIDKAIEYNKEVLTWTTNEPITDEIAYKNLEILGDKENE